MTEFDAKMQQLRAEYRLVLAADLLDLQQQAGTLHGDESDRATLERMTALLHRIAGGAGVFGLAQMSDQAHGLELDLEEWLAAPLSAAYGAGLPEIRAGLASLALKLDADSPQGPQ